MTSTANSIRLIAARSFTCILLASSAAVAHAQDTIELSDERIENIVRRSWQYVAMYNVNNKFAMDSSSPMNTGGWNRVLAVTALADHTLRSIARPNNDTLYICAMLDLTGEPIILEAPAFDSKYVSLMVTGYDHYVNIPMSTRLGDFSSPSRNLFYTERTPGYQGESVRSSIQRQSVSCGKSTQTGVPSPPARCAIAVSTVMIRSRFFIMTAVSIKRPLLSSKSGPKV